MSEATSIALLLADPDPGIAAALRKQLLARDRDPPGLREAVEALPDPADRSRAREARIEVGRDRAAGRLVRLAGEPSPDLEAGAFEVARVEDPDVDVDQARETLDELGRRARTAELGEGAEPAPRERVERLAHFLGTVERYEGDRSEDEIPRSSSLPLVLERRKGLPITLGVLYVLVGRRAGVELDGIGAPLHFLVGAATEAGTLYVDPFDRGRLLDADGAATLLRGLGVVFRRDHLRPTGTKHVLARMARNLVAYHARRPRGEGRARRYARIATTLEDAS